MKSSSSRSDSNRLNLLPSRRVVGRVEFVRPSSLRNLPSRVSGSACTGLRTCQIICSGESQSPRPIVSTRCNLSRSKKIRSRMLTGKCRSPGFTGTAESPAYISNQISGMIGSGNSTTTVYLDLSHLLI